MLALDFCLRTLRVVSAPRRGLLHSRAPQNSRSFRKVAAELRDVDLAEVRSGDRAAVIRYVGAWRSARTQLLALAIAENPELALPPLVTETLDDEAKLAPFSAWTRVEDEDRQVLALDLLARLRNQLVGDARPLHPSEVAMLETAHDVGDGAHVQRFYRETQAALNGRGQTVLQVMDAFGLSKADVARMFGVSRQAVDQWMAGDVPADRRSKAGTVLAIADVLRHRLKAGRLPIVARRPASAYAGRTMLEMIAEDRHEELLEVVRGSFDFARTA